MGVGVDVDVNTRTFARLRKVSTGLEGSGGSFGIAHTVRLRGLCNFKIVAVGGDRVKGDLELRR